MDKIVDQLNERASKLDEMADKMSLQLTEERLRFESLILMQKEERIEDQKMHQEETERIRKHYGKIIIGLILTLCLFIGGVFGAVFYFLYNYDIAFGYDMQQSIDVGGD